MSTNLSTLLDKHRTLLELRTDPDLKTRIVCYHTPRHLERLGLPANRGHVVRLLRG